MPKIIEIKARSTEHEKVRSILLSHNPVIKGTDHQIDTYFNVPNGRLKLREGTIENNLIHYHRSNQEGPKLSSVSLYKSQPDSTLKAVLEAALGVKVVVDKMREIYFIDNVKFHIDTVEGLGTFVEIEAIDDEDVMEESFLLEQCQRFMKAFGIKKEDLVAVSYSDLLMIERGDPETERKNTN